MPTTRLEPPATAKETTFAAGLLDRVRTSIDAHRLTLVVGQGGSGKTTLARACTDSFEDPVAWLRLHPRDDDPRVLVQLVAASVTNGTGFACSRISDALGSSQAFAFDAVQLAGILLNDLAEGGPVVLVLDDLHHLGADPTVELLSYLLDFAPPNLRVVATARRPPSLPLARMRSRGELGEFGPDDLRLDPTTGGEVLRRLGLDVDSAVVETLVTRSHGWVTGFLLAARAADGSRPEKATLAPEALADFLSEEVVAAESPAVQEFLRAVSILDDLDPDRCAVVSGVDDAELVLTELRGRLGLLVEEQSGRLRLHDLLAEHLRAELAGSVTGAQLAELHRRAAATATDEADRIDHLLAAGDHAEAGAEIESRASSWQRNRALDRRLLGWIDELDPSVRAARPWLDLVAGVAAANTFDVPRATALLDSVMERSQADDDYELRWLATASMARATHDIGRWAPELGRLEQDERFDELPVASRVEWLVSAAWGALWSGETDRARVRAEAGIDLCHDHADPAAAETLALHLGFPLAVWPGAVERFAMHHGNALERHGDASIDVRIGAKVQRAALAAVRGEPFVDPELSAAEIELGARAPHWAVPLAFARAARSRHAGDHHGVAAAVAPLVHGPLSVFGVLLIPLLASSCRQHGYRDDLAALQARLAEWRGGAPGAPAMALLRALSGAQLAWAEGRLDEAAAGFRAALDEHRPVLVAPVNDPGVELALVLSEAGRTDDALATLASRLDDLVGRLRCAGRVAQSGPELQPLLERLADGPRVTSAARVLEVLGRGHVPAPRHVPTTGETLTSRELEVLGLVAAGASNGQLADSLCLSVNTVKTHVRRVLAKLGASSRTEAVAVARSLRLI